MGATIPPKKEKASAPPKEPEPEAPKTESPMEEEEVVIPYPDLDNEGVIAADEAQELPMGVEGKEV